MLVSPSLRSPPPQSWSCQVWQMCTSLHCRQSGQAEMLFAGYDEMGELHPLWSPAAREHLFLAPVLGRGKDKPDNKHLFPVCPCLTPRKRRHLAMLGPASLQGGSQQSWTPPGSRCPCFPRAQAAFQPLISAESKLFANLLSLSRQR